MMECIELRIAFFLCVVVLAIICFAILGFTSAADVLQGPSIRTVNVGSDGSVVHSTTLGGYVADGSSPAVANLHDAAFRTLNDVHYNGINNVLGVVPTSVAPLAVGVHGPTTRTVNIVPDASFVHGFVRGVAPHDGSVLVAPYLYSPYVYGANRVVVPNSVHGVHTVIPGASSYYAPGFYSNYQPIPYGRTVVTSPLGTLLAK